MTENDNNNHKRNKIYPFRGMTHPENHFQELRQALLDGLEYTGSGEKILDNLYYGNLQVTDSTFLPEYYTQLTNLVAASQQLKETLTDHQKELYQEVSKQNDSFIAVSERETFAKAFRLGARIMHAIDDGEPRLKRLHYDEIRNIIQTLYQMDPENSDVETVKTIRQRATENLKKAQRQLAEKLPENLKKELKNLTNAYDFYINQVKATAFIQGLQYGSDANKKSD